jgi:class 3 adenylate cyclase
VRDFDEIKADIAAAMMINDINALQTLATEMEDVGTPHATAVSEEARGWISYILSEYTEALAAFQQAAATYEQLGEDADAARVTGYVGEVYRSFGDSVKALEFTERALGIYVSLNDTAGIARAHNLIGMVYISMDELPFALEHLRRALSIVNELGNKAAAAHITNNLSIVYRLSGDYASALDHAQQALEVFTELGDRSNIARATNNSGSIHEYTGNIDLALENYMRALEIFTQTGERDSIAGMIGNIGVIHQRRGETSLAQQHYREALDLFTELGDKTGVARMTTNLSDLMLESGAYDEARRILETLDHLQSFEPVIQFGITLQSGKLLEHDGDLDTAASVYADAATLARMHALRDREVIAHAALRELAERRNDLPAYIEHNNEYTRLNEELRGKDASIRIAMLTREREIVEREKEMQKYMAVLRSTLPATIADRVARGERVNDQFDNASVMFLDIVGFTAMSSHLDAESVVALLDRLFSLCDEVAQRFELMKIKTIGDSYMAVVLANTVDDGIVNAACAAAEIIQALSEHHPDIRVRIGIHNGPVVAGILGKERMQYDVWGDTVNVASRMESHGEPGRIHVSEAFANSLTPCLPDSMTLVQRGVIDIKGKGPMTTYWLERGFLSTK